MGHFIFYAFLNIYLYILGSRLFLKTNVNRWCILMWKQRKIKSVEINAWMDWRKVEAVSWVICLSVPTIHLFAAPPFSLSSQIYQSSSPHQYPGIANWFLNWVSKIAYRHALSNPQVILLILNLWYRLHRSSRNWYKLCSKIISVVIIVMSKQLLFCQMRVFPQSLLN